MLYFLCISSFSLATGVVILALTRVIGSNFLLRKALLETPQMCDLVGRFTESNNVREKSCSTFPRTGLQREWTARSVQQ
eukprot:Gb_01088 [translate_table: standard]